MKTTTQEPTSLVQTTTVPETVWKPDPAHSSVQFTVRHMMLSEVMGKFKEFDATLVQTTNDFSNSKMEATINAGSILTEVNDRDNHLRSADFFDVARYPTLNFKSNAFVKTNEDTFSITGDLTIHGVTKPIELKADYLGQGVDPWGNLRVGFKATARLNRYDYGLQWNQALETGGILVGKEVGIVLTMQFLEKQ